MFSAATFSIAINLLNLSLLIDELFFVCLISFYPKSDFSREIGTSGKCNIRRFILNFFAGYNKVPSMPLEWPFGNYIITDHVAVIHQ